jgi:hypothetical protein
MKSDEIARKNKKKSIKHRNRELKVEELNRIKKIKLNKMSIDEIEQNPNFKKVQKPNKQ